MSKSNKLIALLNVWGILFVVLGHCGFEEPIIQENLGGLHRWIYSFHMPLFFFLSGYLFSLTNPEFLKIRPRAFLHKKVLRLLIPYVVLGTVLWGIKYLFSSFSHAERDFGIESFFMMFIAPTGANSTMGYLWYVVTLFEVFVLVTAVSLLGVDLKKGMSNLMMILCCWGLYYALPRITLFNLSSLLWYLPFFLLGISFQNKESILTYHLFRPKRAILGGGIY